MGEHRRIAAAGLALGAVVIPAGGCERHGDVALGAAASAAEPLPKAPADSLLPFEIAAGSADAFGLPIPRLMSVRARFPDAVFAVGELPAEHVATYVRRRVVAEHVETGSAKTVFTGATLRDKPLGTPPDKPLRSLRIEVIARGGVTTLVVRDETRPPAKEGLSEGERWRELGLTPRGAPLDPTRLE